MPGAAVPDLLARRLAPFAASFTRPTWRNVLALIAGAILAPGRRTVTAAPSIMGLEASLWADGSLARDLVPPRRAAWYPKPALTFSDALGAVRSALWTCEAFPMSADHADVANIPRATLRRLTYAASFPA